MLSSVGRLSCWVGLHRWCLNLDKPGAPYQCRACGRERPSGHSLKDADAMRQQLDVTLERFLASGRSEHVE